MATPSKVAYYYDKEVGNFYYGQVGRPPGLGDC